jgi:hypothetical protein
LRHELKALERPTSSSDSHQKSLIVNLELSFWQGVLKLTGLPELAQALPSRLPKPIK